MEECAWIHTKKNTIVYNQHTIIHNSVEHISAVGSTLVQLGSAYCGACSLPMNMGIVRDKRTDNNENHHSSFVVGPLCSKFLFCLLVH